MNSENESDMSILALVPVNRVNDEDFMRTVAEELTRMSSEFGAVTLEGVGDDQLSISNVMESILELAPSVVLVYGGALSQGMRSVCMFAQQQGATLEGRGDEAATSILRLCN